MVSFAFPQFARQAVTAVARIRVFIPLPYLHVNFFGDFHYPFVLLVSLPRPNLEAEAY